MENQEKDFERRLLAWRQGLASIEEVQQLAADTGKQQYTPGVPALLELLNHDDAIVRYNAGMSLTFELQYKPALDQLLRILVEDSDEECRDMAAQGIGSMFRGTNDPRILVALSKAALEDSDKGVRSGAYRGLLRVHGLSNEEDLRLLLDRNLQVDPQRIELILSGSR